MTFCDVRANQRGDTIVEVLIAVAVITLVLAGAYKITARNTIATQDTQEHSYALKLAETQTEKLRAASKVELTGASPAFCFSSLTGAIAPYDDTNDNCKQKQGGADYLLKVTKPSGPNPEYVIEVKWQTITGTQAVVTNYYARYD